MKMRRIACKNDTYVKRQYEKNIERRVCKNDKYVKNATLKEYRKDGR